MNLSLRTLLGPACVSLILLVVTGAYWHSEEKEAVANQAKELGGAADRTKAALEQRFMEFDLILRGTKGFYEGSKLVSQAEFKRYVQTLGLDSARIGLQGIAIVMRVSHADKDRFADDNRRKGIDAVQIRPEGVRAEYRPIVMIEPLDASNANVLGFDIGTNPVARLALDQSLLNGPSVVTGRLTLAQDGEKKLPAWVMYLPLTAENSKAVIGWVSGPFRLQDVMDSIRPNLDPNVEITIFDGSNQNPDNRVYGESSQENTKVEIRHLDIGGQRWTIAVSPNPIFEARNSGSDLWFVVVAGSLASLLFGYSYWLMITGRERAKAIAEVITYELRETNAKREATLNAIPDLLFEVDASGQILNYHAGRAELLAAPPEVFLGRSFADVLPPEATEVCMNSLRAAARSGWSTGAVYSLPLPQGATWFELSVSALPVSAGAVPRFMLLARDITERKRIETALRDSNEKLQLLETCIARLDDIVLITEAEPFDEPGPGIVFVNDAFERRTGFTREEALGKSPRFLQGPKTDRLELDRIRRALERWEPVRSELLNYTKSGEEFWLELNISPVANSVGWYTHWVAVERDITERRRSEQLLRENEAKLAFLLSSSPAIIYTSDTEPPYAATFISENVKEVMGFHPDQFTESANFWADRIHPEDQQRIFNQFDEIFTHGHLEMEYRFQMADGSYHWIADRLKIIQSSSGESGLFIGYWADINEMKQVENKLRESEASHRELFDSNPHPMWVYDLETLAFLAVNDSAIKRYGYKREEFLAMTIKDIRPPEDIPRLMDNIALVTDGIDEAGIWNHRTKDGRIIAVEIVSHSLKFAGRNTELVLAVDVTKRQLAENQLHNALHEKTALLLEVHHRVKNNLQVISSLLRLEGFRSKNAETSAVLQDMQGRVRSMALLHESIYRKGTFAAVDLGGYLAQVAGDSLKSLRTNQGAVALRMNMGDLRVSLDQATPAGMLISELVSNSLKHAFPNGRSGEITISLQPLAVPGQWRLDVRDNGIGLPADFEARRNSSLGLQLAGDMASQMGGALQVVPGEEAAFTIDFFALELTDDSNNVNGRTL